jgi:hypothetical protein
MKFDPCLFITATIAPGDLVPSLKRKDRSERENDYVNALSFWTSFGIPIVFCENSDTRSTRIVKVLEDSGIQYEYLTFKSKKSMLGKGHGEIEIFEYAFRKSEILNRASNIIKVTGRYIISNFNKILSNYKKEKPDLYVNLTYNLKWADSRFFCFTSTFFKETFSRYSPLINEQNGIYFEHVLAKSTLDAHINNTRWSFPVCLPIFKGIYGTDNIRYKTNLADYYIKNCIYKIKRYCIEHLPY